MAVVVEPMLVCCFVLVRVEVLYCLVGVTRGAQGSRISLCGLPGPVGLIATDVWWRPLPVLGSLSSVSSSTWSSVDPLIGSTSVSVACTSLQNGPRKARFVCLLQ